MAHASDHPAPRAEAYFASRGWTPFAFQREAWATYARGGSGLVHAPTGMGKTLAVWMGAVEEALADTAQGRPDARPGKKGKASTRSAGPLRVLWITPMRALAGDTLKSLRESAHGAGLGWDVQARTGDTSASLKARFRKEDGLPQALVTTPESLSVMLSYPETGPRLAGLRLVVVDEWHELLGTKRGVQAELCLAHLRRLAPGVRTWGLSATLSNVDHALGVLVGAGGAPARLVQGDHSKRYAVETLLPASMERFPWAGHIGLRLLGQVLEKIDAARSTLLFCNTRGQAEIWFQALVAARPQWIEPPGAVAIHHGSLDRDLRGRVEDRLKHGTLRCVVCTSSLDLGVDFPPVDQVIQVGSAKGVGRFVQRAGRSGHQPGRESRLVCVPTNAWELVEFAAARRAIARGKVEARWGLRLSLDVLCQHLLTLGAGGGFRAADALAEARATHAFAGLTDEQFGWALDFAVRGGSALGAYPRFARLRDEEGLLRAAGVGVARLHRQGIGTIMSDAAMAVKYKSGRTLGTMEESFLSRLRPGDVFVFAGKRVEMIAVRNMVAYVKPARAGAGAIARWGGARMPLSHELAEVFREVLGEAQEGAASDAAREPELRAVESVLEVQRRWSRPPRPGELLIERCRTREGHHAFLYPMEGRLVHEGLATLLAFRVSRLSPRSFTLSCNDLGLEMVCNHPLDFDVAAWRALLSPARLGEDLLESLNASELARRQFREVARVAGLLSPGLPGQPRSQRQLQASSELFFDVFEQFDPGNLLLDQARREVLERQLQVERMLATLQAVESMTIQVVDLAELSPLAFPLWADSLREQLTSERWSDRVKKMQVRLEEEADRPSSTRRLAWTPTTRAQVPRTGTVLRRRT